jgi:hypothetical protein
MIYTNSKSPEYCKQRKFTSKGDVSMIEKVYELEHDLDRFEGLNSALATDGYLEHEFEGYNKICSALFHCASITIGGTEATIEGVRLPDNDWRFIRAVVPENITFVGLTPTDYPYIDQVNDWPIMSKRMVEAILSVGDVSHQIVPLIFKDEEEVERADVVGDIIPTLNRDYVLFQTLELLDVFDKERSIYTPEPCDLWPGVVYLVNIREVVLKEPESGFPSIFRVKGDPIPLYVSAKAKDALEKAGIQGLRFSAMNWS